MMPDKNLSPIQRASQYLLESARELEPQLANQRPEAVLLAKFTISVCAYLEAGARDLSKTNISSTANAALAVANAEINNSAVNLSYRLRTDWRRRVSLTYASGEEFPPRRQQPYVVPKSSLELLDMLETGEIRLRV